MYSLNLVLITILWFGSLDLLQLTTAATGGGGDSGKAYEDTNNAYQPGQPLKTVLTTLDKVLAPVALAEDEPEVMHYLPVPAEIKEKAYETFLPTNVRWEIKFHPEGFRMIDLEE